MPVAATVIAARDVARARVLAGALEQHDPDTRLVVLMLDDPRREALGDEPFEALTTRELVGDERELLALDPDELAEAMRPRLIEHLLADGADVVVLLEPGLDVLGSLSVLSEAARTDGVALVPRLVEPVPADGQRPDEEEIAAAGLYRSGQLAVGATQAGRTFTSWWRAAADGDGSESDPLDRAPLLFDSIAVVRDAGWGAAYWNLHARPLDRTEEGTRAAGRPLRTLYLPGFDPQRPHWLGDANSRVHVEGDDVLRELLDNHARRLLDAGHAELATRPWGYETLPNGVRLDRALRDVLADALAADAPIGDPLTTAGADRLVAWAAGPARRAADWGVNRYLLEFWRRRGDLREAFPDLEAESGDAFVRWTIAHGDDEGIPAAFVPADFDRAGPRQFGVNVAGYLSAALGIGEAGRLYVHALRAADVPVRSEAVEPPRPDDEGGVERAAPATVGGPGLDVGADFPLNLVCVNAPQVPGFVRRVGAEFFVDRRTVGVWAWETTVIPPAWDEAFRWVDEIWTYSTYVASLIAPRSPVPVVAIPLPLVLPPETDAPLEIELEDRFTFLFMFDFFSTAERKNPVGLVEAFTRAFAPGEGPQLVVKSFSGDYKPEQLERLRRAARGRPDVVLVDRWISAEQRRALMDRADCYVSLHRSEGFGLTLAEAMGLGKPVIATGYSGNLDFMDGASSYLVDHALTEVGPGVDIYPENGVWADPDLDHAAELMRRVVEHPEEAAERAERGRRRVLQQLSPAACGAVARARLEQLYERFEAAERTRPVRRSPALELAAEKAAYDPLAELQGSDPRELAKRGTLRAMRPYTHHQRELNDRLVDALRETEARLQELDEAVNRRGLRVRRTEWRVRHLEARIAELEAELRRGRGEG